MKELERVKEFMETLEFHGYIDHDPTKLKQLIEDYYPIKQGKNLPLDSVSVSVFSEYERESILDEIEFVNAQNLNGRETDEQLYKQGIADSFDYLTDKLNSR
jgi:hypothetical protein